jgi:two-component system alkaline phosphatase synthesis response regulator PhoP
LAENAMPHPSFPTGIPAIDPARGCLRVRDRDVFVTPTQLRIFALLLTAGGQVVSRADLIANAIGVRVTERTVDVHVKELRRKLGADGLCIRTVRGRGYSFQDHHLAH